MKSNQPLVFIFALCLIALPSLALADAESRACVKQSRSEHVTCITDCKITRDNAILNCLVPEGDCGDSCKAAYTNCVEPFQTQRESCQAACETDFEASRVSCGTVCSCTPGVDCTSTCFGACMDGPAIVRASCRAACIRNVTYRGGIKACGRALRLCSKGCDNLE